MFKLKLKSRNERSIAFYLDEKSYSVAAIQNNEQVLFAERRELADKAPELMVQSLTEDVERLHLIGKSCRIVLPSGQYQLLLMDALDIPEDEMIKALRWRLKGLVDYPLNDLAIDVFPIPPHGVLNQRKKIFVAVTMLSALKAKLAMFESAYLKVESISISEMALRNILGIMPNSQETPIIVIGFEEDICQLRILKNNQLFLVRELNLNKKTILDHTPALQNILLEIQRSMDYCQSELKLPEPQQIILIPGFNEPNEFVKFLQQELGKDVKQLDLAEYLQMDPALSLKNQQDYFYSIGGALNLGEK